MSERAMRDLVNKRLIGYFAEDVKCETYRCPPLNSVKLCFQTEPNLTLTSKPSIKSCPSGGCSFAKLPGSSSPNIEPKSLSQTFIYTSLLR